MVKVCAKPESYSSLSFDNFSLHLRNSPLFPGFTASFSQSFVGFLGANGVGKSSLFRFLLGRQQREFSCTGSVDAKFSSYTYIPQCANLEKNFPIKVKHVVRMGVSGSLFSYKKKEEDVLEKMGIYEKKDDFLANLSGGEFQRVLLARALLRSPEAYFLDEPFCGIDEQGLEDMMIILRREACTGNSIFLIIHDEDLARKYCDILCILKKDQVVCEKLR